QVPQATYTIWKCGKPFVDTRDGQTYETVEIGEQCWMAENLNIGAVINGMSLQTDNGIIEKYCFNDIEDSCNSYGGLYQWDELMQYDTTPGIEGLCPGGWHIPTDEEWKELEGEVDSQFGYPDPEWDQLGWRGFDAGGNLKEAGTTHWTAPNTGGINLNGFTALPGGCRHYSNGTFLFLTAYGYWWSSSKIDSYGTSRRLSFELSQVRRAGHDINHGFSVRCLKNQEPPSWSCGDSLLDNRDGQKYGTVEIGDQCWMDENLNIGTMINGSINQNQQTPEVIEKYCYDNNTANCDEYGGLYQWNEMMQYVTTSGVQGICPTGWHLPTDPEWCTLEQFVDPTITCSSTGWRGVDGGSKLKEAGTTHWQSPNTGTNSSGFTALPGGYRNPGGGFSYLTIYGRWWSSSESGSNAWYRHLNYSNAQVFRGSYGKDYGFSVRCLKNQDPPTWSCGDSLLDNRDGQKYGTVEIGDQCWMAENLNIGTMINGTNNQSQQTPEVIEKYCYDNNTASCDEYGGLYQWNEMMQYVTTPGVQGICSDGWHLPTDAEWCTLEQFVDPTITCNSFGWRGVDGGGKLKEVGITHWQAPNTGATNLSGFTGLPGGTRYPNGNFNDLTSHAYWWSTAENGSTAWFRLLHYSLAQVTRYNYNKDYGFSVRCLKNQDPPTWSCGDSLADTRDGQKYGTVQIDDQCWMDENLNIGDKIDGSLEQQDNSIIEKYCYGNNNDRCNEYGGLYQWNEAMGYNQSPGNQGICPEGWHVPTDGEFIYLEGTVDSQFGVADPEWYKTGYRGSDVGGNLKETGILHWYSPNTGATNNSGFNGLGSGFREGSNGFWNLKYSGHFWSSIQSNSTSALERYLSYNHAGSYRRNDNKNVGVSLRCIKDVANVAPNAPFNPIPADGAQNIGIDTVLQWSCTDPDGDLLSYKIYFGLEANPPLFELYHTDTVFDPGILLYDTAYYWKIVVFDMHGDSTEGLVWNFSTKPEFECGDPLFDDRDGQYYNTVEIGTQCWMAENLNVGIRIDGINDQTNNQLVEKYCYNDIEDSCDTYGGLYQWNEMMQYVTTPGIKGICPDNWHLPTDAEWCTLEQYVDPTITCSSIGWRGVDGGGKLKEAGTTHWLLPNTSATNSSGFTALPGGYRHASGFFESLAGHGHWWSSSESGSNAWHRFLAYNSAQVGRNYPTKSAGTAVRCLQDELIINQPPTTPSNPVPSNDATNIAIDATLSWSCSDPENDPLNYDVYFGTINPPQIVNTGQTDTTYNPGLLTYDTTYYWKIVAHDDHGNLTEGPEWSFTTKAGFECGDPLLDARDNQVYNTVEIGIQCWMAENLNIGTMINGNVNQSHQTPEVIEKYCYSNNTANCDEYGGLYQWNEAMQYVNTPEVQGICPSGWHFPTDEEWKVLEGEVDSQFGYPDPEWDLTGGRGFDAGLNLKSVNGWNYGGNGTNLFGFNALPGGYHESFSWQHLGNYGEWWTSSGGSGHATYRNLGFADETVHRSDEFIDYGLSVRCLKD
ncbi:MAG: hypothetical protein K8R53_14910, partial [Bacteroidales bacterium]|nr:hypothetical protein [Bacteroidales bacterium]